MALMMITLHFRISYRYELYFLVYMLALWLNIVKVFQFPSEQHVSGRFNYYLTLYLAYRK